MDSFWEFAALVFWFAIFMAYLMVMFHILGDLFRDSSLSGWVKGIWVIALIFFPFITALVYLIGRGKGMAERQMQQAQDMKRMQDEYIRTVASPSSAAAPADQIASAKALLDSGAINQAEFDALKAKALA